MGKKKSKKAGKATAEPDLGSITGDAEAPQDDRRPGLDTRRDELQAQLGAVDAAEQEVARLEHDLENNSLAVRQQESAMEAATARVADLEKALKKSAKQRKRLRADLETARAQAEQARGDAVAAEANYEKAVLKQVVRRAKAADLTINSS